MWSFAWNHPISLFNDEQHATFYQRGMYHYRIDKMISDFNHFAVDIFFPWNDLAAVYKKRKSWKKELRTKNNEYKIWSDTRTAIILLWKRLNKPIYLNGSHHTCHTRFNFPFCFVFFLFFFATVLLLLAHTSTTLFVVVQISYKILLIARISHCCLELSMNSVIPEQVTKSKREKKKSWFYFFNDKILFCSFLFLM